MKKFTIALIASAAVLATSLSAFAADHKVKIQGFKFSPASLNVAVGDTVTFTNADGAPHTATGGGIDTGTLKKGESKTVTISAAGDISYKCKFHPMMKGQITAK